MELLLDGARRFQGRFEAPLGTTLVVDEGGRGALPRGGEGGWGGFVGPSVGRVGGVFGFGFGPAGGSVYPHPNAYVSRPLFISSCS